MGSIPVIPSTLFLPENGMQTLPLATMFPSPLPIEIDFGSGKGGFLLARAKAHPETNFIGIERMFKRIRKVSGKIEKAGLANVRLLRVECLHAARNMLPAQSVQAAYVFFPDPWPKRRHQPRRLISAHFVDALSEALIPGGMIHIMTDHLEYFEIGRKLFEAHNRFVPAPFPEFPPEERTDFEKMFEKLGRPIGRAAFRKTT